MKALSPQFADRLVSSTTLSPVGADAELIAVCAEFRASEAAFCAIYDDAGIDDDTTTEDARTARASVLSDSWTGMLDRMSAFHATTHEGLAARALALAQHSGIKPGSASYAFGFEPDETGTVTGRLLHYLLRDAAALGQVLPSLNPDAELLALRPEFERLRAERRAEDDRPGDWSEELETVLGKPFDEICAKIIATPPAVTRSGRALKAIAAMDQIYLENGTPGPEDHPIDHGSLLMCWNLMKQEVGDAYRLPGERA